MGPINGIRCFKLWKLKFSCNYAPQFNENIYRFNFGKYGMDIKIPVKLKKVCYRQY